MSAHTMELPIPGLNRTTRRSLPNGMAVVIALLVASALCAATAWRLVATARSEPASSISTPALVSSFGYRASHNGRYHAEVVSRSSITVGEHQRWTIRVTRHNHRRLAGATITAETCMLETGARSPIRPSTTYLGGGRYQLDDVYFPRAGWWNVALAIDGRAGTDSLAFNVVVR